MKPDSDLPIGSVEPAEHGSDSMQWWESRRWRYNLNLVIAGWVAFALYCLVCWTLLPRLVPAVEIEITLFTMMFQGVGYLVAMGVANVCYLLGPFVEAVLKPAHPATFRQTLYTLGTAFSVGLPFLLPASMAWWSLTGKPLFRG